MEKMRLKIELFSLTCHSTKLYKYYIYVLCLITRETEYEIVT